MKFLFFRYTQRQLQVYTTLWPSTTWPTSSFKKSEVNALLSIGYGVTLNSSFKYSKLENVFNKKIIIWAYSFTKKATSSNSFCTNFSVTQYDFEVKKKKKIGIDKKKTYFSRKIYILRNNHNFMKVWYTNLFYVICIMTRHVECTFFGSSELLNVSFCF